MSMFLLGEDHLTVSKALEICQGKVPVSISQPCIERIKESQASARSRGRLGGRPKKISNQKKLKRIQEMYDNKEMTVKEICEWASISKATLYNYIQK